MECDCLEVHLRYRLGVSPLLPDASMTGPELVESTADVGGTSVRSLKVATTGDSHVVVVPGLGALGYLLPTVRAVAARGGGCTLLDLPGFGSRRPLSSAPQVGAIASVVAAWVRQAGYPSVALVGHSTGAQVALLASLQLQDEGRVTGLVLAGPTVAPRQRHLARLAAVAPAAYRRDRPTELKVVPDYLRGGPDVVRMLQSAIADRPEFNIRALRVPVLVTAGRADSFAPSAWLYQLAGAATHSPWARVVHLPGSHNNPYVHPGPLSAMIRALDRSA